MPRASRSVTKRSHLGVVERRERLVTRDVWRVVADVLLLDELAQAHHQDDHVRLVVVEDRRQLAVERAAAVLLPRPLARHPDRARPDERTAVLSGPHDVERPRYRVGECTCEVQRDGVADHEDAQRPHLHHRVELPVHRRDELLVGRDDGTDVRGPSTRGARGARRTDLSARRRGRRRPRPVHPTPQRSRSQPGDRPPPGRGAPAPPAGPRPSTSRGRREPDVVLRSITPVETTMTSGSLSRDGARPLDPAPLASVDRTRRCRRRDGLQLRTRPGSCAGGRRSRRSRAP